MKNLLTPLFFLTLALPLLLFEAAAGVALMLVRLGQKWRYEARILREPPPLGGMYGTMARRLRERTWNAGSKQKQPQQTEE